MVAWLVRQRSVAVVPKHVAPHATTTQLVDDIATTAPPKETSERTEVGSESTPATTASDNPSTKSAPCCFYARVIDAGTGAPIAGAEFWTRKSSGFTPDVVETLEASSGVDGRVVLAIANWTRKSVRVVAAGCRAYDFTTDHFFIRPDDPLDIELARPASLDITVRDATGSLLRGARVSASVDDAWADSMVQRPRPAGHWAAPTDDDGRARLDGIQPEVALAISVSRGDGARVEQVAQLALVSGEQRELDVALRTRGRIEGHVTFAEDATVYQHSIALVRCETHEPSVADYAWLSRDSSPPTTAEVDLAASGDFAFDDVPTGEWWLEPRESWSEAHDSTTSCGYRAGYARHVVVEAEHALVRINVAQPRTVDLAVHVVGPTREAWPEFAALRLWQDASPITWLPRRADTVQHTGPLAPGSYEIEASSRGFASERVRFDTSTSELTLQLLANGAIHGLVVDPREPEPWLYSVVAVPRTPGESAATYDFDRSGQFALDDVRPGLYDVIAHTRDGRVGVAAGVDVRRGATRDGVSISIEPRATLHLRYVGSRTSASYRIWRGDVCVDAGELHREVRAQAFAPPGDLRIELSVEGRIAQSIALAIEPGERREVALAVD
jgi:hypothetical protein